MVYPFMTLEDETEMVHSEMKEDGSVKVYFEKPDAKDGFHYTTCWLPDYRWEGIFGFDEEEMSLYRKAVASKANPSTRKQIICLYSTREYLL